MDEDINFWFAYLGVNITTKALSAPVEFQGGLSAQSGEIEAALQEGGEGVEGGFLQPSLQQVRVCVLPVPFTPSTADIWKSAGHLSSFSPSGLQPGSQQDLG